jgi:hypothetical protein
MSAFSHSDILNSHNAYFGCCRGLITKQSTSDKEVFVVSSLLKYAYFLYSCVHGEAVYFYNPLRICYPKHM